MRCQQPQKCAHTRSISCSKSFSTMPPRRQAAASAASAAAPPPPAAAAAASVDPNGLASDATDAEPAVMMPRMNISTLKKFQNLFIVLSHNEVRQRGVIPAADQQRLILEAYQRNVRLWFRDDATLLQMENMPSCPQSIKALGSENAVVRCMLATTNTGRNKFTGPSMMSKFDECKKSMLNLIATWNLSCDAPAQAATIASTYCCFV